MAPVTTSVALVSTSFLFLIETRNVHIRSPVGTLHQEEELHGALPRTQALTCTNHKAEDQRGKEKMKDEGKQERESPLLGCRPLATSRVETIALSLEAIASKKGKAWKNKRMASALLLAVSKGEEGKRNNKPPGGTRHPEDQVDNTNDSDTHSDSAPEVENINNKRQKPKHTTTMFATSNKCIASSNKCLTSSNKKLVETINPPTPAEERGSAPGITGVGVLTMDAGACEFLVARSVLGPRFTGYGWARTWVMGENMGAN